MDNQTFCAILESALLSFDEVSEEKIVQEYGIKEKLAKAGVELCIYLKSIKGIGEGGLEGSRPKTTPQQACAIPWGDIKEGLIWKMEENQENVNTNR